ncbi:MAG: hypothetical protein AB3N63_09315 [Puniceicoccaceae bacterium]
MRPGALLLKFRKKYGKGFRVAWYRDRVRPKILQSKPCTGLTDDSAEIHVLTSEQDWLNLLWTLKSFYNVSENPYRLVIHEDGSLGSEEIQHMKRLFPDARIVLKKDSDAKVLPMLDDYPKALEFRSTNPLSLKLFDFPAYLESKRMFLLDSDILFYTRPDALLDRIGDPGYVKNIFNRDVSGALNVDVSKVRERFGFDLLERFNSGLGLIHKDSIKLDWIEEFLDLDGIQSHHWRIEQTLIALCSCRFGAELLPQEYDVYLDNGLGDRPSRHYVGAVRHLMYAEGMKRLFAEGLI